MRLHIYVGLIHELMNFVFGHILEANQPFDVYLVSDSFPSMPSKASGVAIRDATGCSASMELAQSSFRPSISDIDSQNNRI